MEKKIYVLGGAQTDFERNWTKEGKTEIALLREVMADALASVQLDYSTIKALNQENRVACFVGNFGRGFICTAGTFRCSFDRS